MLTTAHEHKLKQRNTTIVTSQTIMSARSALPFEDERKCTLDNEHPSPVASFISYDNERMGKKITVPTSKDVQKVRKGTND